MKKKLTAFLSAVAVMATMVPSYTVSAGKPGLYDKMKDFASKSLSDTSTTQDPFYYSDGIIRNTGKVKVSSDMRVKESAKNDWYNDCTYSAGKTLNASVDFDFKTTLKMTSVLDEYNKVTQLAKNAIALSSSGTEKTELLEALENDTYINDAEFIITIQDPDNIGIPESAIKGKGMLGFKAIKGSKEISPADNKITIVGDASDNKKGSLVYYESEDRKYDSATNTLTITVKTNATSHKALAEALQYDLVLECDGITAMGPSAYSSSKSYKLIGTVAGNSPIYIGDGDQIADITYVAFQDPATDKSAKAQEKDEISASVTITTSSSGSGGGGGGGSKTTPKPSATPVATPTVEPSSTPTAEPSATPTVEPTAKPTLTPTLPPGTIVIPEVFNADDHFAYIIGYPEGDVRPNNNISREEVATIFFRLLKDSARAKIFDKNNEMTDVEYERWSNNAIATLENGGYVTGYEDGTFKPANYITRAEFVTIAVRFFDTVVANNDIFEDVDAHWAEEYINAAVYYGLIDGYGDGTFKPNQYIKRCEAMKIVNNILNRHVDKSGLTKQAIAGNWIDNSESAWYYTEVLEATRSHDFTRRSDGKLETWTAMKTDPDWEALEKTYTQTGTEENRPY